jgi:hypothetical protein
MRQFKLVGAAAALVLAAAAFYGSQAVAGEYDDCASPTISCIGTCLVGSCTPIATSLAPLQCPNGDPNGYRNNGGNCGSCTLLGVVPTGDGCGQPLSSEAC